MMRRELHVYFTDGTSATVAHDRDDEQGRESLDREAVEWLRRPLVKSVEITEPTERVAGRARGYYR